MCVECGVEVLSEQQPVADVVDGVIARQRRIQVPGAQMVPVELVIAVSDVREGWA